MKVRISFHNADQDVASTCHYIEYANKRWLIDCDFYQGEHPLAKETISRVCIKPSPHGVYL